MDLVSVFLIAIGLSMDAVAVSMVNGMYLYQTNIKKGIIIALSFGIFQGIMPVMGYLAGSVFTQQVSSMSHWIALILLGFIGAKMIYSSIKDNGNYKIKQKKLTLSLIIAQAIATSIDAFAIGISFATLEVNIVSSAIIIALTTFVFSFFAVFIGKKFGDFFGKKAEIFGGTVLILIGLKTFVEHMFNFKVF